MENKEIKREQVEALSEKADVSIILLDKKPKPGSSGQKVLAVTGDMTSVTMLLGDAIESYSRQTGGQLSEQNMLYAINAYLEMKKEGDDDA